MEPIGTVLVLGMLGLLCYAAVLIVRINKIEGRSKGFNDE